MPGTLAGQKPKPSAWERQQIDGISLDMFFKDVYAMHGRIFDVGDEMGEPFRVQIDVAAADRYVGPFQDAADRYALMNGGRIEPSDEISVNFRVYFWEATLKEALATLHSFMPDISLRWLEWLEKNPPVS